jgi:hypothetical protein
MSAAPNRRDVAEQESRRLHLHAESPAIRGRSSARRRRPTIGGSFARLPRASATLCYLRVSGAAATGLLGAACAMRASRVICDGSRRGDMSRLSRSWNGSFAPKLPSVIGEGSEIILWPADMSEPPIGIEPMTYALRVTRFHALDALAAPIARTIAQMALTALGLSTDPFHEPFHARRLTSRRAVSCARQGAPARDDTASRAACRRLMTKRLRADYLRLASPRIDVKVADRLSVVLPLSLSSSYGGFGEKRTVAPSCWLSAIGPELCAACWWWCPGSVED